MNKLTDKTYWEEMYSRRNSHLTFNLDGLANFTNRLILNKMLEMGMENKRVIEIGAGDSVWLPYLARKFNSSQFVGVDYSESGCILLTERAHSADVKIEVMREDMFVENSQLHGTFDVAISFGVVEHFDDLGLALAAKKRYLRSGGVMFALIPNFSGILGKLTRTWNRDVYDKHNPHDWISFLNGHKQAGLEMISGGYLGSSNFGVLSSCFPERRGLPWQISRGLVAASLATWWFENKIGNLPSSKTFSPYIYAISRQV